MGNKVNPIGMRLQVNRTWDSRWYADTKDYGDLLLEDLAIRDFIKKECHQAGVARVIIERPHKKCRVTIHTARPGVIIGKKVDQALTDLTFSKKRIAHDVKKCLQSAIANAENNHNLDVDELIVAEAYVGKNLTMKRGRPRARGRFGKIIKPFSEITIKVRQVEEQA